MTYTHILELQLPNIPTGYFPMGDLKSLDLLYKRETMDNSAPVTVHELVTEPAFVKEKISKEMIAQGLRSLKSGDKEIKFSSKAVALSLVTAFSSGTVLSQTVLATGKTAWKNKKLPTKSEAAFPLMMAGAHVATNSSQIIIKAQEIYTDVFKHRQTDDFICNEDGYFVSKAWLNDPENAKRLTVLRPHKVKNEKKLQA